MSWGPNRIDVVATDPQGLLQHSWWDGTQWSWQTLPGTLTSSPEAASWGIQRLDVYGLAAQDQIYHEFWNGTAWSAWTPDDNQLWTADPGAVARNGGVIDLFERGANGALWVRETDGT